MSAKSIHQAFFAIWRLVSGLSIYHEICTFSIFFVKPGLMADTLLILALPSFWSLWLFPMSMLSFSPNYWSCSWASQDLVQPFSHRVLMNAHKASWMTCAMHGMWFLKCRPLDSRGLKYWLQLACHRVIWGTIVSRNTEQQAIGEIRMIQHVVQMYG